MTKTWEAVSIGVGCALVFASFGGAMLGIGVGIIMFSGAMAHARTPAGHTPDALWALRAGKPAETVDVRTEAPRDDQTRVH